MTFLTHIRICSLWIGLTSFLTVSNGSVSVVLCPRKARLVANFTAVQKPAFASVSVNLVFLQLVPRRKHLTALVTPGWSLRVQLPMSFDVENRLPADVAHGQLSFTVLNLPLLNTEKLVSNSEKTLSLTIILDRRFVGKG
jgi:hypothetical protein